MKAIQGTYPVPIPSINLHYYSISLRGNHLRYKKQLVGYTVSNKALASDAIKVIAKYDLPVSHWLVVSFSLFMCVCAHTCILTTIYYYINTL